MADTTTQLAVEGRIVVSLQDRFGCAFTKRQLKLTWGGLFEFDAVSEDSRIAACISTSRCRTANGKPAIGKYHKIRSDALYLMHAMDCKRRLMIFTDASMTDYFQGAQKTGRLPPPEIIEVLHIPVPFDLDEDLVQACKVASSEVTPQLAPRTDDTDGRCS